MAGNAEKSNFWAQEIGTQNGVIKFGISNANCGLRFASILVPGNQEDMRKRCQGYLILQT